MTARKPKPEERFFVRFDSFQLRCTWVPETDPRSVRDNYYLLEINDYEIEEQWKTLKLSTDDITALSILLKGAVE